MLWIVVLHEAVLFSGKLVFNKGNECLPKDLHKQVAVHDTVKDTDSCPPLLTYAGPYMNLDRMLWSTNSIEQNDENLDPHYSELCIPWFWLGRFSSFSTAKSPVVLEFNRGFIRPNDVVKAVTLVLKSPSQPFLLVYVTNQLTVCAPPERPPETYPTTQDCFNGDTIAL